MSALHEKPGLDEPIEFREGEFEGRIVLVVGGSRGIGAEVARLAASLKAALVVVNSREESRDQAVALLEEIEELNVNLGNLSRYVPGDITVPGVPSQIVQDAARSGRIDDVIISAGTRDDGIFMRMDDATIRRVMETNFFGPAFIAREAIIVEFTPLGCKANNIYCF